MFESTLFQDSGVHIIFKMAVVKWQSDTIEAEAGKELGVVFSEEVLEELIKEELALLFPKNLEHRCTMLTFVSRISRDEIFHAIQGLALECVRSGEKYVSYFIHPPNPAPLKITGSPLASITFSPWTLKNPLAILTVAKANLESRKSGIPF
jgi:hypothetical protein